MTASQAAQEPTPDEIRTYRLDATDPEIRRLNWIEWAAHVDPDNDWPHCKRCGSYEWDHRDGALGHKMAWPPMTAREIRAADRIMETLR